MPARAGEAVKPTGRLRSAGVVFRPRKALWQNRPDWTTGKSGDRAA